MHPLVKASSAIGDRHGKGRYVCNYLQQGKEFRSFLQFVDVTLWRAINAAMQHLMGFNSGGLINFFNEKELPTHIAIFCFQNLLFMRYNDFF